MYDTMKANNKSDVFGSIDKTDYCSALICTKNQPTSLSLSLAWKSLLLYVARSSSNIFLNLLEAFLPDNRQGMKRRITTER